AGTAFVETIPANPGTFSFPQSFTAAGGNLFFTTDDGVHGSEPWVFPLARVESVVIDDGSAQRSMVRSITVTFSTQVTLQDGAFQLVRDDGTVITPDVAVALVNGKTVATLTFSGPDVIGGSLADGRYTLTLRADRIANGLNQALDGDGDGTAGG